MHFDIRQIDDTYLSMNLLLQEPMRSMISMNVQCSVYSNDGETVKVRSDCACPPIVIRQTRCSGLPNLLALRADASPSPPAALLLSVSFCSETLYERIVRIQVTVFLVRIFLRIFFTILHLSTLNMYSFYSNGLPPSRRVYVNKKRVIQYVMRRLRQTQLPLACSHGVNISVNF